MGTRGAQRLLSKVAATFVESRILTLKLSHRRLLFYQQIDSSMTSKGKTVERSKYLYAKRGRCGMQKPTRRRWAWFSCQSWWKRGLKTSQEKFPYLPCLPFFHTSFSFFLPSPLHSFIMVHFSGENLTENLVLLVTTVVSLVNTIPYHTIDTNDERILNASFCFVGRLGDLIWWIMCPPCYWCVLVGDDLWTAANCRCYLSHLDRHVCAIPPCGKYTCPISTQWAM